MKPDDDLFRIDETNLDKMWFKFPREYMKQAVELADAREELERSKAAEEVAAAEVDRDVRREPIKYGIEKITEKVVENAVLLSEKYRKARERTIKARHSVDIQTAYVHTLDAKKAALENGVKLLLANYFSEPREKESRDGMNQRAMDKAFAPKQRRGDHA